MLEIKLIGDEILVGGECCAKLVEYATPSKLCELIDALNGSGANKDLLKQQETLESKVSNLENEADILSSEINDLEAKKDELKNIISQLETRRIKIRADLKTYETNLSYINSNYVHAEPARFL